MFTWAEEAIPDVVFIADTNVAFLVVDTVCIMVAIVTTRAAIIGAIAIPYAEVFLLIYAVILESYINVSFSWVSQLINQLPWPVTIGNISKQSLISNTEFSNLEISILEISLSNAF